MTAFTTYQHKPVAIWLAFGSIMLIIQILLGGITRLTGSGLSITQWGPILGALPPFNETAWKKSFALYQHIAQFKKLNSNFTLADYKSIFFWEWLHREWARLMGLVFLIPFGIFIFRRMIGKELVVPLALLFISGALQGVIGWIMVKTGLNDSDISVSHISLAIHFIFALLLLCYVFWFLLSLTIKPGHIPVPAALRKQNILLLVMLTVQLIYGAFMAGTHAGLYAPTWPKINGSFLPVNWGNNIPHDLFYSPLIIQFIHRCMAFFILITLIIWYIGTWGVKRGSTLRHWRSLPIILVFAQVTLGVFALLHSGMPDAIYFSILHQFVGILLLLSLVATLYLGRTSFTS